MTRRRRNARPIAPPLSRHEQDMVAPTVRRLAGMGWADPAIADHFAEYGPFAVTRSQVRHLRGRLGIESAWRPARRRPAPARVPISEDLVAAARAAAAAADEPPAAQPGALGVAHGSGVATGSGSSNWLRGPDGTEPFCTVCQTWIDADRTGRATSHNRLVWLLARGTRTLSNVDCTGYGTPVDWRRPDAPVGRTRQAVAA